MTEYSITIDGVQCACHEGEMILPVALRNGIEIPNLCDAPDLAPYGGCGLCMVEVEGARRLMRACSNKVADGMVIHTDTEHLRQVRKVTLELLMSDHSGQCASPCSLECPARTDVQGYLKCIAEGDYSGAVRIIKDKISLPASIGRVCPHPCEEQCRRELVDEPLSIAYLKAFAADADLDSPEPFCPEVAAATGKRVAIVGGGPAGLNAAYRLRVAGHEVCVFDAMPEMGGMLRYGIPEYRLPKAVLAREVEAVRALGVELRNNVRIGEDLHLADLREQYDAVLLATGAWSGTNVGCPGELDEAGQPVDGVVSDIDFLRQVNQSGPFAIGSNVAVVGGGNTAMDACRTALRCGAERVYVVYRRTRAEAPADDMEIAQALEEGVEFVFLANPAEILVESGRVSGLRIQRMQLGEPDASGRCRPEPIPGALEVLDVDCVISAIGQRCDACGLDGVRLNERGNLAAAERTFATNLSGVFAAGDATNRGAGIAIQAIAEANDAADALSEYLALGADSAAGEDGFWAGGLRGAQRYGYHSELMPTPEKIAAVPRMPRAVMGMMDAAERAKCFDEVILGFTEEQARSEAGRCLECGCHDYKDCKLIRYANLDVVEPGRFAGAKHPAYEDSSLVAIQRDQGKCILCSQCVRECSAQPGQTLLGLVGRGNQTVIRAEYANVDVATVCGACRKCFEACPTGALRLVE